MIRVQDAIAALHAQSGADKAADMRKYHKVSRPYLGVANPDIDAAAKNWRAEMTLDERLTLAAGLWDTNIHEGRVAAAKLLVQARIKPDEAAWVDNIRSHVEQTCSACYDAALDENSQSQAGRD